MLGDMDLVNPDGPVRIPIVIFNVLNYQADHDVIVAEAVGKVFVDDCISWYDLATRIFQEYSRVAADPITLEQAKNGLDKLNPSSCWPGRETAFYSKVNGELNELYFLLDAWDGQHVAQTLYEIHLMIPRHHLCSVILAPHGNQIAQFDIEEIPDWIEFAVMLFHEYFDHAAAEVLDAYPNTEITPLTCCPGAEVTYWGDIINQQIFASELQLMGVDFNNWFMARVRIHKVLITPT